MEVSAFHLYTLNVRTQNGPVVWEVPVDLKFKRPSVCGETRPFVGSRNSGTLKNLLLKGSHN